MLERDPYLPQSGVIPYRQENGQLEILLITSNDGERWVVPKGFIEPGLTAAQSAAKEALEEAGIEGVISEESLGFYTYRKWGSTYRVELFLLRVTRQWDHWQESHRCREWLTVADASGRVSIPDLQNLLLRIPEQVAP
jgi:phosphohistidine phosphatase